ncbi:DUF7848 domain-containing protein [Streptomyces sp. NPDC001514]
MSAGNGTARGRFRFAEWTLTADAELGLRHYAECRNCGAKSVDTADPDDAQVWCLKHAGLTGHTSFEMTAFQLFEAAPTGR